MASRSFGRSASSHSMNARMELARTAKRLRLSASAASADTGSFKDGCFKPDLTLLPVRLHGRRPAAIAAVPKPWSFSRTDLNPINEYFKRNTHTGSRCPGKKPGLNHQSRPHPLIAYSHPLWQPRTEDGERSAAHFRLAHGRDASAPLMQPSNPCLWLLPGVHFRPGQPRRAGPRRRERE